MCSLTFQLSTTNCCPQFWQFSNSTETFLISVNQLWFSFHYHWNHEIEKTRIHMLLTSSHLPFLGNTFKPHIYNIFSIIIRYLFKLFWPRQIFVIDHEPNVANNWTGEWVIQWIPLKSVFPRYLHSWVALSSSTCGLARK